MHLNWGIRILFKWMDGWVTLQWHAFRLTLKIVWVVSLETLEIKQAGSDLQERSKGQGQGHGPTWDNKKPEIMKEGQVNSKNFRANTNAFCREDVCERKTFFLCAYTCVFCLDRRVSFYFRSRPNTEEVPDLSRRFRKLSFISQLSRRRYLSGGQSHRKYRENVTCVRERE